MKLLLFPFKYGFRLKLYVSEKAQGDGQPALAVKAILRALTPSNSVLDEDRSLGTPYRHNLLTKRLESRLALEMYQRRNVIKTDSTWSTLSAFSSFECDAGGSAFLHFLSR